MGNFPTDTLYVLIYVQMRNKCSIRKLQENIGKGGSKSTITIHFHGLFREIPSYLLVLMKYFYLSLETATSYNIRSDQI